MIKLWDAQNLPLEDFARLAYATDDSIVVSIKMVRAIADRAVAAEREYDTALQELQNKLDAAEAELCERED